MQKKGGGRNGANFKKSIICYNCVCIQIPIFICTFTMNLKKIKPVDHELLNSIGSSIQQCNRSDAEGLHFHIARDPPARGHHDQLLPQGSLRPQGPDLEVPVPYLRHLQLQPLVQQGGAG